MLVGGGTLFLGIMAWRTIRQTRSFQKGEHRQRLLSEIIQWAIDTKNISGLSLNFQGITGRSQYISSVASKFGQGLQEAVDNLIKDLEQQVELINQCQRAPHDEFESHITKANEHKLQLDKTADWIIEEATKIKTKDIGKKVENMSKEGEGTGGNEPTLKGIEEHLKRQDNQSAKGKYLAMSSAGVAVALVGLSLLGQGLSFLGQQYYGLILIALGLGFMLWCRWEQSKVK